METASNSSQSQIKFTNKEKLYIETLIVKLGKHHWKSINAFLFSTLNDSYIIYFLYLENKYIAQFLSGPFQK